jgi:hypothetical protein
MAARHLVPFGPTLRAGDPVRIGFGDDGEFHGPSAFGAEYILQRTESITRLRIVS